jgi:cytochrome P450
MARLATGDTTRNDPLADLVAQFDGAQDVWRPAPGRLCVADPAAAREVMANRSGAFVETSDFFHTREGVFGPRSAQVEIGRAARDLLRRHIDAHRPRLPALVRDRLTPVSRWPDAGNMLIREHLRDVLLHPGAQAGLCDLVDAVISRAVLAGARSRYSALTRMRFRRRVMRMLGAEVTRRRAAPVSAPRDLLDVVVAGAAPGTPVDDLAEVYLSFLFAAVGSVGFALGWSIYLAGSHPDCDGVEPEWIAREALRLWPVAWLFARTPSRPHELAGVPVEPTDEVHVCAYLVHRHPGYWDRPDAFLPRRWAGAVPGGAFLPFGHGAHACTGASVTMTLLADLIRIITQDWQLSIRESGQGPTVGPALAPPCFTAELHVRSIQQEGR